MDNFHNTQETLDTLAADTGGKALLDSNDLTLGMTQVQKDMSSYYMLTYASTNTAEDGKYRRIQVKLAPKLDGLESQAGLPPGLLRSHHFRQDDRHQQRGPVAGGPGKRESR